MKSMKNHSASMKHSICLKYLMLNVSTRKDTIKMNILNKMYNTINY